MAAILDLREIPCGALATAYKPYPSSSGRANEDPDDGYFPVCRHGGWSECSDLVLEMMAGIGKDALKPKAAEANVRTMLAACCAS